MNIFNSQILEAAKNAGISITVTVGVLSIFILIATLRGQIKTSRFITIVSFGGLVVVCLMFVYWLSVQEVYQWVDTKALADWAGNDEGWTDGRAPSAGYCDRSREGTLAVCWSNRPDGHPEESPMGPRPVFKGTPGAAAWCTYKLRETVMLNKPEGLNPGRVFVCARVSI